MNASIEARNSILSMYFLVSNNAKRRVMSEMGEQILFVPGLIYSNFSHNNYHMKFVSHGLTCDDFVYFDKDFSRGSYC